ncbi:MAG: DUF2066 domain-containing protein [Acidihalobacter sp.]
MTGLRVPVLLILLLTGFAAVLFARPAAAVEATGLYRVTLPVADRNPQTRDSAFQQALGQVLIKVSGSSQIVTQPPVQEALKNPANYVQQFAYHEAQPAATSAGSATGGSASAGLELQVRFDPVAIDRLLSSNGLPLWGRERPLVILWIGVSRGNGQRFILGSESDSPHPAVSQAVKHAAQARGLPIFLPLMDLQDQGAVNFSDLNGGFLGPVLQASARYDANAVLAGAVRPNAGQWRGQWQLAFRNQRQQWTSSGATQAQALAGGISGAADRLASMLAVSGAPGGGRQAVFVQFDGVQHVAAFARIEHLLGKLTPVKSAQLVSADGGQLVFKVVPRGQASDVARNLGLINWLQSMQTGAASAQGGGAGQTL